MALPRSLKKTPVLLCAVRTLFSKITIDHNLTVSDFLVPDTWKLEKYDYLNFVSVKKMFFLSTCFLEIVLNFYIIVGIFNTCCLHPTLMDFLFILF